MLDTRTFPPDDMTAEAEAHTTLGRAHENRTERAFSGCHMPPSITDQHVKLSFCYDVISGERVDGDGGRAVRLRRTGEESDSRASND